MTDIATAARNAAMPIEAKKDRLSQNQDGLWKITFTVKPEDMPTAVLNAAMGTRYMLAAVEIGDDEQPINRQDKPLTEGEKAKRHFEATCQDKRFGEWINDEWAGHLFPNTWPGVREAAKQIMDISSANDLLSNPAPWNHMWISFQRETEAQ